jgi:hypothetical protein
MLLVNRGVTATLLVGALTLFGVGATGCGNTCGDGTMEVNGTCVAEFLECPSPGRVVNGTCVGPDVVIPDGGDGTITPPDVTCDDDPSICPEGTQCTAGQCAIPGQTQVATTDVQDNVLPNTVDPTWANEGGKLVLYYTFQGVPASDPLHVDNGGIFVDALSAQTNGARTQTYPLGLGKQEIDPATLQKIDLAEEVILTTAAGDQYLAPVFAPEISGDGLWLVTGCIPEAIGSTSVGQDDLCVASRPTTDVPFTNLTHLSSISTVGADGDPSFRSDPATGKPVAIYSSITVGDNVASGSSDICWVDFDAETGQPTPVTGGSLPCNRFQPGGAVPISDPFADETCPVWTTDGKYFSYARTGLGTRQFDTFFGGSSKADGNVDVFLGEMSANTDGNDLGLSFAPGKFQGIIAWNVVPDVVFFSSATATQLGRVTLPE